MSEREPIKYGVSDELGLLSQTIGSDFKMRLELGEPGKGSFFNWRKNEVIIDPIRLLEDPTRVRVTVAHEGGHRAISRQYFIPDEIWQELGFSSLDNTIEDCRADNWLATKYAGIKSWQTPVYGAALSPEGGVILTPEAKEIFARLGYVPRFTTYLYEVLRYWYKGKFSQHLPADIKEALDQTIKIAEEAYDNYPSIFIDEDEVDMKARETYLTIRANIWPIFKKLIEKDLRDESLRQMINQLDLERQRGQGQSSSMEKKEQVQQDKQKFEEPTKEDRQSQERIPSPEFKTGIRSSKIPEGSTEEGEDMLEQQIEKAFKEMAREERKRKSQNKKLSEKIKDEIAAVFLGEKIPDQIDPTQFSEKVRQRWQEIFDQLPSVQKEKLQQLAQKKLEELEDSLNLKLRGKLRVPREAETHLEAKARKESEKREDKEIALVRQKVISGRGALERLPQKHENVYDKYYKEIAPLIKKMVQELEDVLEPNRKLRYQSGFPNGSRLDLLKAMQFEAKPQNYDKLWQRKNLPQRRDYRFSLLIDLSNTMQKGGKIQETLKAVILLSEVLNQLMIPFALAGFTTERREKEVMLMINTYKRFNQSLDEKMRGEIGEILNHGQGWTPTSVATRVATTQLETFAGKDNFLITLTDGIPQMPDEKGGDDGLEPKRTRRVIRDIIRDSRVKLMAIKLGSDQEGDDFIKGNYPFWLILSEAKQLSQALGETIEDMIINPQKYV